MPAPTNISAATATALGTLPATVTQRVDDAGTTYTVWYKFTVPELTGLTTRGVSNHAIGVFAFGDLVTYKPSTGIYFGDAASPTFLSGDATWGAFSIKNKPIQFKATIGGEYFIKVSIGSNPTPANLTLNVIVGPNEAVPVGSLLVNDDTDSQKFPSPLLSSVDGVVLNFGPELPHGEAGDVLPGGRMLLEDDVDNTVHLFNADLTLNTTLALNTGTAAPRIRTCNGQDRFSLALSGGPTTITLYLADKDGVLVATYTFTEGAGDVSAIALSNDGTIFYYVPIGTATAIKRISIPTLTPLANLVAGVSGYDTADMLILGDTSIVALYYNLTTFDCFARRYNAAGTTLNTYALGTITLPGGTVPRLAYAIDSGEFWAWTHFLTIVVGTNQFSRWRRIRASDGTVLSDITRIEYNAGFYDADATATPTNRFGNPFSCPFIVTRVTIPPATSTPILGVARELPIRWVLRSPVLS